MAILAASFVFVLIAGFFKENIDFISLFKNGKFLVLFQNNSEIRSSGGFIGSYAVVDIKNYELKSLNFNTNIYALDNAFSKNNFVQAPFPIAKITNNQTWALRDANYDASFSDAGKDVLDFYEKETGDKVDGIIALNAKVLVDLLRLTGPIKLDKYNVTVSADNFFDETQYKIEKEYFENPENWVINEPKTFLKDLYPIILNRALKKKISLLNLLNNELATKEIIFYFPNEKKEKIVEALNFTGKIYSENDLKKVFKTNEPVDYLYLNSNSYSGNKSSLSVKQNIDYKLVQDNNFDDKLKANLKITRIHSGTNVWPDGKNTTWLRVYVPQTAQFVSASLNGQDVSLLTTVEDENDKTYFGLEIPLEAGQTSIWEIEYLIPKTSSYQIFVQKQSGLAEDHLTVNFFGQNLFDGILSQDKIIQK